MLEVSSNLFSANLQNDTIVICLHVQVEAQVEVRRAGLPGSNPGEGIFSSLR